MFKKCFLNNFNQKYFYKKLKRELNLWCFGYLLSNALTDAAT